MLPQRKKSFLAFVLTVLTLALALPPVQANWYRNRLYANRCYHSWGYHPSYAYGGRMGWNGGYYPGSYNSYRYGYNPGLGLALGVGAAGVAALGLGTWLAVSHGH